MAEGFGAKGYRAATPAEFKAAFADAMKQKGPSWIDCRIGKDEKVLPMIPGVYAYKTILALMQFMQENQDTATMNRLIVEICKNGITAFFIIFSLVIGVAIPMLMFKRLSYTRIIKPEH